MRIKGNDKNTAQVIHELLERLSQLPQVDIRFDFEGEDTWAVITEFDEIDDAQLSIRFLGNDRWLVVAGDYDEEDDFVETFEELTPEIIQEMLLTTTSERQGRLIDHDQAGSMEQKKREGYF